MFCVCARARVSVYSTDRYCSSVCVCVCVGRLTHLYKPPYVLYCRVCVRFRCARTHTHTHTCVYVCVCVCSVVTTFEFISMYRSIQFLCLRAIQHANKCIHLPECHPMLVCVCALSVCACLSVSVRTWIQSHQYSLTHTHTHTHRVKKRGPRHLSMLTLVFRSFKVKPNLAITIIIMNTVTSLCLSLGLYCLYVTWQCAFPQERAGPTDT